MRVRRLVAVVVLLTAVWVLLGGLALRDLAARRDAAGVRAVARVRAVVDDVRGQLEREARLLAADPLVAQGAARGDWAALARGASPRMLSVTIDGLADLLLIVDARGEPVVQIPAGPAPGRSIAPASPDGLRVVNGRAYVVASALVGGTGAGAVIVGRSVESFARALGRDDERVALAALDGDRVAGSTLRGAPVFVVRGDSVRAADEQWTARSLGSRAGLHLVALAPRADAGETGRLWGWLGGTLLAALAAVAAVARRTAVAPATPAAAELAAPPDERVVTPAVVVPRGDAPAARLAALAETTRAVTSTLDVEGMLDRVVAGALRVFGAGVAGLWLTDDGGATASLRARAGTVALPPSHQRVAVGQGLVGGVIASGESASLADVATEAGARVPEDVRALGIAAVAVAPVRVGETVLGALAVGAQGRHEYSADDLHLLESLASQAGGTLEHARLYRAAARSAERMAALVDLGRLVSETLDPEIVTRRIAESLQLLFRAHSAALLRLVPETGDLVVMSVVDTAATFAPGTVFPRGMGTSGRAVTRREAVITPDLLVDPRIGLTPEMRARIETAGYRSVLTLPLMMRDRVIGALTVADTAGRVFTDEEVRLAQAFGDQAAVAFENARLFAEGGRRRHEAEEMARVARTLTESLDVRAVAQRIVDSVLPLFGAAMSGLRMLEPENSLVLVALGGPSVGHFEHRHVQSTDEGLLGAVVTQGRSLTTADILNDRRFSSGESLRTRIVEAGHRALLAVPLRAGVRVVGVLYIAALDERHFTEEEALLLQAFGDQAALALENARLYAEATQRLRDTQALLEVAEILNSTLEAPQVLKRVAMKIAQVCRVGRCSIQRWDGDHVVPLMSQFADGRPSPEMWKAFTALRPSSPREVRAHVRAIETRRPVIIDDVARTDLIPREWIEAYGIKSYMVVPLIRHDALIGVMNLDHHEQAVPFEPAQVDLALAVAGQLALFLENARLYAEARERLWETTTLVAVSQALSQSGPTVEIMRRVAREMTRAFGADMTGMYVLDAARERLVPLAGHHVPQELVERFRATPIPIAMYPKLKEAWREGRAVWSRDPAHDPRFEGTWHAGVPLHSVLFAAVLSRGEPVGGMFVLWWGASRDVRPSEVRLIEAIAAQVGLAFENLDLTRQTEIKLRETETLLAISRTLATTLDQDALLRQFLRRMAGAIDADSVGIWTVDETGEWLVPLAGYRVPPDRLEAVTRARISLVTSAFYGDAARSKRPVFSRDVSVDPRVPDLLRDLMPHRSHLFVPVVVKDRVRGGIAAVWWNRERDFSESDLALSEAIASQVGVTLENLRLFDENRQRVNELSVLYDLSRAVTGQLSHDAVVAALETHVARVLDVGSIAVVLRYPDPSAPTVVYTSVHGERRPELQLPPGRRPDGLVSVVLETGRPLRTDEHAAECARHGVSPLAPGAPLRSVLIAPMKIGDTPIGALGLGSDHHHFTAADERLLCNIADLGALALSSARLFEDRTRAYQDLAAAQDQLVRTEKLRALGEMASGIAHDFNNLLAAILGRAQLLLGRVEDPQLVRWLQVIERSALDGAQTVRRLQEFTRVRRDAPLVPVDLNEIITDALEMTQSRWRDEAQSRGIGIELDTRLEPVPAVAGDAAGLREAFTNLILNAVDAMPAGGVLGVATRATDAGIDVVVRDTGTGMSETVRERIFDPFFTTKGPQGTGLGLAMTFGIVSRHGAGITVESEEGVGSTFRLRFPRTQAVPPVASPGGEIPAAEPVLRCLVVDDEEAVGMVLGDVLQMSGHTAVVLTDAAAAIERFRAEPFDVVFTDLAMPGISGWQVIRAVKAIAPTVPVFLVTGFGVELSAEERRAHGVEAVLAKPLKIDDLRAAVRQAARRRPPIGEGSVKERSP